MNLSATCKRLGLKHLEDEIPVLHEQLDGVKKQLDFIAFRLWREGGG